MATSKSILEIVKFGIYISVPIALMYFFANNTRNLQRFISARQYLVYPPEGERPPSPEDVREMARELAQKRNRNG